MDIPSMIIGAGLAMLLANIWVWFVLPRWHERGRRLDRRRTEARLRTLAKWKQAHPEEVAEVERAKNLAAWKRANGASRSAEPSAPDGNTHGR